MLPDHRDAEHNLGPDLSPTERRIAAWRPSAVAIDRDRMLYEAGRASARAAARPWQFATAAALLLAVGLGGWASRERSRRVDELAARPTISLPPLMPEPIEPPDPNSYRALSALPAERWEMASAIEFGDASKSPHPDPAERPTHPTPLRPQDILRVLDL